MHKRIKLLSLVCFTRTDCYIPTYHLVLLTLLPVVIEGFGVLEGPDEDEDSSELFVVLVLCCIGEKADIEEVVKLIVRVWILKLVVDDGMIDIAGKPIQ